LIFLIARYSPNGKKIVYGNRNDGDIHVVNADGSHDHALTNFGDNNYPDWSPDGRKIVFDSDATGTNQAWIMNADGTHDHAVTTTGISFGPVVSPSGTKLLYVNPTHTQIYVSNLDGSNPQLLTTTGECCVGWLPK
jgi:TolB protein